MKTQTTSITKALLISLIFNLGFATTSFAAQPLNAVSYKTVTIDGLDIFYREAGNPKHPTILLLHGFPTSSHMFRDLITALSDRFHLVAPDYPGYGYSSMPTVNQFDYSFDNLANVVEKFIDQVGLKKYSLYLMDYGAPIGFRIATKHPEQIESLIIQNGNAYVEGIDNNFWEPIKAYWKDRSAVNQGLDNNWWKNVKDAYKKTSMTNEEALRFLFTLGATKWQYTNGVRNVENINPDTWKHVQPLLDRKGNQEIQLQLFYSYGSNPPLYPKWQAYLHKHQPPTLIVWGKNDEIFPAEGAHPYKRDLKKVDFHLLDTGHFALEEDGEVIAEHIRRFIGEAKGAGVEKQLGIIHLYFDGSSKNHLLDISEHLNNFHSEMAKAWRTIMKQYTSDIAFTKSVKAIQTQQGSRDSYARVEKSWWPDRISPELVDFILERDSFYMATVNGEGQPYIQHRGGPKGFLKVLDDQTLSFADFRGNRQYISYGNLEENNKICLFLMDYPNRIRIKIWGTAEVKEDDQALISQLSDLNYKGKSERAFIIHVKTWDKNCPQHITRRYSIEEMQTL